MNKRTLLITGSSTGFGHATAKLFADKGCATSLATM
jgi:NADP-dependent 3-hydroxy acid dehydrogenase YdfG